MLRLRDAYVPSLACVGTFDGEPPAGTDPAWVEWWRLNRASICGGEENDVPVPRSLPHPSRSGFVRTRLAEGVGQIYDWALPLSDGSRLHVHEFANGSLRVHRDATDPGRGLTSAVWHWLTESVSGRAVIFAGIVVFATTHAAHLMAQP